MRRSPLAAAVLALVTLAGAGAAAAAPVGSPDEIAEARGLLGEDTANLVQLRGSQYLHEIQARRLSVRLGRATDGLGRATQALAAARQDHGPARVALVSVARVNVRVARQELQAAQQEAPVTALDAAFEAQEAADAAAAEVDRQAALVDALEQEAGLGSAPTSEAPSGDAITREAWADRLLGALGAPVCAENRLALVTWQAAEGTSASWNPLATTLPASGNGIFNGAGVRDYPTLDDGLGATVATLDRGRAAYGYEAILDALGACAPALRTATAIHDSSWCGGCAGGQYVIGVLPAVADAYPDYAAVLVSG